MRVANTSSCLLKRSRRTHNTRYERVGDISWFQHVCSAISSGGFHEEVARCGVNINISTFLVVVCEVGRLLQSCGVVKLDHLSECRG